MPTRKAKCPLCGEVVPREDLDIHLRADTREIEDYVLSQIRTAHPEWVRSDGTCPKCWKYYLSLGRGPGPKGARPRPKAYEIH